jgi:hypothetical protein
MAQAHSMLDSKGYKNRLSLYVILVAYLLQKWLDERAPALRYTYILCLVDTQACMVIMRRAHTTI